MKDMEPSLVNWSPSVNWVIIIGSDMPALGPVNFGVELCVNFAFSDLEKSCQLIFTNVLTRLNSYMF